MNRLALFCIAFGLAIAISGDCAAALFTGIGDLAGGSFDSLAIGVSASGNAVVGRSQGPLDNGKLEGAYWTPNSGIVALAGGEGSAYGASADGAVIVGQIGHLGFRWTQADGTVALGDLAGGAANSLLNRVSADGSIGVGYGTSANGHEAAYWSAATGWVGLGDLPGGEFYSDAFDVSANGSVIVGVANPTAGQEAFRWTQATGMIGLGNLPGGGFGSSANGVSPDGSVVVGVASNGPTGPEAFRWSESTGMVGLGLLDGAIPTWANAASDNGTVVVGYSKDIFGSTDATIWDATEGMRRLSDVLENDYGLDLTGWTLKEATDVSTDGRTIVGVGINPHGNREGWIANLEPAAVPEPSTFTMLGVGVLALALSAIRRRMGFTSR